MCILFSNQQIIIREKSIGDRRFQSNLYGQYMVEVLLPIDQAFLSKIVVCVIQCAQSYALRVQPQNINHVLMVQVRFHPLHPHILASGSLDQEVRLWDANTSECIISHHFCMFTYCESLLFFSKLLLLSCNCYYICFCSFSCVYWFLFSLMNSLGVSSHRSSHCIYCFSCQR